MKIVKIVSILISLHVFLVADVFDGADKARKPILYPVLKKEYRKFVPLLQRELSAEELEAKKREEKALKEQINKTFTKKEEIEKIKKADAKINATSSDVQFFDSLEKEKKDDKPINMENPIKNEDNKTK